MYARSAETKQIKIKIKNKKEEKVRLSKDKRGMKQQKGNTTRIEVSKRTRRKT